MVGVAYTLGSHSRLQADIAFIPSLHEPQLALDFDH